MAPSRALQPIQITCQSCLRLRHATRRAYTTTQRLHYAPESSSHLPRVATPSFWTSLLPKSFRSQPHDTSAPINPATPQRWRIFTHPRDWNPYTIFILLALLAGSNAIQILALRNDTLGYTRKTEAKLGLLREVIKRVKAGEEVDVRKALGTGDAEAEAEWEEVVRELANEDSLAEGWRRREEKRKAKAEGMSARAREGGGGEDSEQSRQPEHNTPDEGSAGDGRRPKFMM